MPAGLIAARVLECEGVDAVALLDGVLAIGIAGVDGRLDGVEGGRGGKLVYYRESVSNLLNCIVFEETGVADHEEAALLYVPFLRDMAAIERGDVYTT